jgi:phenylacetate-CoA ligase
MSQGTETAKPARVHADLQNPEYVAWLRFLETSETWSREEIERYQLEQFRKIVAHAYSNTAAYRELWDRAGVSPESIRALGDVQRLPLVTRDDIRDRLVAFRAPWANDEYVTTGGSTGVPLGFYRNRDAFAKELASKAHQYHRIGWREGDRQLVLRGLTIDALDQIEYVENFEELRCSSYHLTDENMERYYRRALEYQPRWLRCYPSAGSLFARFLDERGWRIPSIVGVLCASENLYDGQRALLQKVFSRVFSHYGHYELAALAGYCEHESTYHVLPQYGYAELVDAAGPVTTPGSTGEIVATSFLMYATPFVRYRTGDVAVLKGFGCAKCGRPYQVWERIDGRLQEFVQTATGRLISMTAMNMHDGTFDQVQQFQFHQSHKGEVVLQYVPRPAFDSAALQLMRARLMAKLGNDMKLDFKPVESIALTKRGKHRFLIQELKLGHGDA